MLVSHTVMPWIDDVNQLNSYGLDHDIDKDKWHLLTGNKNELYDLARFGYFADGNFLKTQSENDFIHTENFVLVDKLGYIRGLYNGTIPLDIKRLIRHITRLKSLRECIWDSLNKTTFFLSIFFIFRKNYL